MKPYEIHLEISGDTAMWTRPDTGDCPVSYPAPTFSAVAGIFQAIAWGPAVEIVPFKVEICKPLHFHLYSTNYSRISPSEEHTILISNTISLLLENGKQEPMDDFVETGNLFGCSAIPLS